jgi:hypothetical protein
MWSPSTIWVIGALNMVSAVSSVIVPPLPSLHPHFVSLPWIGLLAVGFNRFGKREELEANPIRHLFDVYVQVSLRSF